MKADFHLFNHIESCPSCKAECTDITVLVKLPIFPYNFAYEKDPLMCV